MSGGKSKGPMQVEVKVEATEAEGGETRRGWTELCKRLERRGGRMPYGALPAELRLLLDEPMRSVLFFMLDPVRERHLLAHGHTKGLPVRRNRKEVYLVRSWRWRLQAAGCEIPYSFETIGAGGSIFRASEKAS